MTKSEAKAYAQNLAKESGLTDDQAKALVEAFDNDKIAQGLIPLPEFSRGLDVERAKSTDALKRNKYLEEEWLPTAKAAYEKNIKGIAMLEKYQATYGPIDETTDPKKVVAATGLSEDKIRELLTSEMDNRFSSRDQATLDLMDLREEYAETFKKRMPIKEFEKFVGEQKKSGEFQGLRASFRDWIEPDKAKIIEKSQAEHDQRIRDEAVKDFASRNHIPTSTKPTEPHLLFDRVKLDDEKKKPNGQSGRDAFLEVLADPDPDTVRQRYPV